MSDAEKSTSSSAPDLRVGTLVIFVDPDGREEPAVVTRVWGSGPRPTVNIRILPDSGATYTATSVSHWHERGYWPPRYCYREA